MNSEEHKITGLMVYYYFVCKRKLWYFSHEISMEQTNENVQLGKLLDENSFSYEEKHINIDNVINIDFIREKHVIYEIKKSRKIEKASIWQVKYYLYYLQQHGMDNLLGKIDYPLLHQTLEVNLSEEDCKMMEEYLNDIKRIIEMPVPMKYKKKNMCKACAFYDLCAI